MKKITMKQLITLAYGSLAIAVLSVFTTVVRYTNSRGARRTFSIFDFLSPGGNGFDKFVSSEYKGRIVYIIDIHTIRVLVVIAILSIVCAFVGLLLISKQRENGISFTLTVIALVGTMILSVLILIIIGIQKHQYLGRISSGIYPVVSPITMAICIVKAAYMHYKNVSERRRIDELHGLIQRGGDLD